MRALKKTTAPPPLRDTAVGTLSAEMALGTRAPATCNDPRSSECFAVVLDVARQHVADQSQLSRGLGSRPSRFPPTPDLLKAREPSPVEVLSTKFFGVRAAGDASVAPVYPEQLAMPP